MDSKKYYALMTIPGPVLMIIGNHLTLSKTAALKCMYELSNIELRKRKEQCIKKELEKPFIIAYWNCFERVI